MDRIAQTPFTRKHDQDWAARMDESDRKRWIGVAMLAGVVYPAVGLVSAALAATASSDETRSLWRMSAFLVSAAVFAAHLVFERNRLRAPVRVAAWHVSLAVAFGAFSLALVANIRDLGSASGYRPRMLIALVAWPLLTAVPAFLVALAAAAGLRLKQPS